MEHISNLNWKTIPGFPKYAITPDGQIWSYYTNKFLKPWLNKGGYLVIDLCNDLKRSSFLVHRLVGMAFVKLPEEFNGNYDIATIDHIDGNKLNNHYTNLEWVTREENSNRAWDNGLCDYHKKPCFCVSIEDKKYTDSDSASDMAQSLNLSEPTVYSAINNANGVLQGKYIVGYVEDFDWGYLLQDQGMDAFIQTYSDTIANYKPKYRPCFYIDSLDNSYHESESARDIDKELNLPIGTTSNAIYRRNGLIQGRYIAGTTDDPRWKAVFANFTNRTIEQIVESYADQIERHKQLRGPKKITNLQTGESKIYNSLAGFAREHGLDPSNAGQYLRNHSDLYRVEPDSLD